MGGGRGEKRGRKPPRRRLGHSANIRFVALAGLCVAALAAGGSYAAWVPRNSVGATQLKKGSVSTPKIRTGAVRSLQIARGAVQGPEIASEAVGAGEIATGALPRAYALIRGWPSVAIEQASSQRVAQAAATLGTDGYVCITGLDFDPVNVQTTVLGTGQNAVNSILNASTKASGIDVDQCPGDEDVAVVAIDAASGVIDPTPPSFFLALYD